MGFDSILIKVQFALLLEKLDKMPAWKTRIYFNWYKYVATSGHSLLIHSVHSLLSSKKKKNIEFFLSILTYQFSS